MFGVNIFLMGYYWMHPVRMAMIMAVEIAAIMIANPRKKDWVWLIPKGCNMP